MDRVSEDQKLYWRSLDYEDDPNLGLIDVSQEDDDLLTDSPCFRSSADSCLSDENVTYDSLQPQSSQVVKHKPANLLQEEHQRQLVFLPERLSCGRPSLAWDSAFFTDEGVLDEDELASMNEGLHAAEMQLVTQKYVNKQRVDAFSSASRKINTSVLNRTSKSGSERGSMNSQRPLDNQPKIKTLLKRENNHPLSVKASNRPSPLINLLTRKSRSASVDAYHAKKESRAENLLSVDKLKLRKKSALENYGSLSSASPIAFGSSVFRHSPKISTGSCYSQDAVTIKSEKGLNAYVESNSRQKSSPVVNNVQVCLPEKWEAYSPGELMNYQSTPDAHQVLGESRGKIRSSHLRMPSPKIGFFDEGKPLTPTMRGSLPFHFETQRTPSSIDCLTSRRTTKNPRTGMPSEGTMPLKRGSKTTQLQHPVQDIGRIRSDGKLKRYSTKLWKSGKIQPDVDMKLQSGICEEGEWICSKCQKIGSDMQDRNRVGKIYVARQDDQKRVKARHGRQIGAQTDVPMLTGQNAGPGENEQHKPKNLPSGSENETAMLTNFENQVNDLSKYFEVIDLSKDMQIDELENTILNFTGENVTDDRNQETPKLSRNDSSSLAGAESSSPSSSRTPLGDKTSISNRSGSISAKEKTPSLSSLYACSGKENSFPRGT